MDEIICKFCFSVVKVYSMRGVVEIYDPKYEKLDQCKVFAFDAVYDWK